MPIDETTELVAFDLETTGLDPILDRIIEIGAIRFDRQGNVLDTFQSLVNPGRPSDPRAFAVHQISDAELLDAEPASIVLERFLGFLGEPSRSTLIAHNASFDASFLGAELNRSGFAPIGSTIIDTLALSRQTFPSLRSHRLDSLAKQFGFDRSDTHRALSDCKRVMSLWLAISDQVSESPRQGMLLYEVVEPDAVSAAPEGWDELRRAVRQGLRVRMSYQGGTRGADLREITPRRFTNRGGIPYVVSFCHLDEKEKAFRLDRVARYELIETIGIV